MIVKAVITYDDGTEKTFEGTPAVPAVEAVVEVPAVGVDLSTIPTSNE